MLMDQTQENTTKSYNEIINKAEAILKVWKQRHLTLLGKVTMLNSLVGSLFIYRLQVLPKIPIHLVNRLNKVIQDFILK